jgi:hypothetical protein
VAWVSCFVCEFDVGSRQSKKSRAEAIYKETKNNSNPESLSWINLHSSGGQQVSRGMYLS